MEGNATGIGRVLVLAFCVAGIWSAYISQGVLRETLSTKRFGPDGKRFEHLSFLNLLQNVICFLWSLIMIKLWSRSTPGAPWWGYWIASITNTIGPAMGIEALKYISYPAQVLAKSSKMIPDAETKQNDARVKKWVADVRDISYKAEDAIDTFIFQIEQSRRRGSVSYIPNITSFVDEAIAWQQLHKMIEEIKSELDEVGRRRKTYGIISLSKGGEGSSSLREQRRTSPLQEDTDIVGFQEDIITLVARLIEGESRRCVISVVGMGGLGKTTLTRKVYNHDDVKKHFDCCAWIYVSQEYDARDLLQRIMGCCLIHTGREMDEMQMRESIFEHLKHKRYFVVVDDIWKTEAWDALAAAFPDMNNRSRVILTTCNRDVALHADIQSCVHDLKLLKTDESWKLFCQKIFFEHDSSCPQDLERLGKEIVAKCHGLPLAVVVVGGLLSRKARLPSQWEKVLKSLCWPSVEGQAQISRILALSYEDLPYYLKPCFLYLGVYPEDHKFSAKELIQLWVAEGFVHSEGAKTLEEVGEDCLEELIQRSLIQIVERSLIGGIKSCGIHDLLRDLSLLKAKEENFLNVNAGGARYLSPKARRLAMHHGNSVNASLSDFPLNLRSIIWFSSGQLLRQNGQKLILGGFRLLGVLHLRDRSTGIQAEKVPKEIGTLIHVRYLAMTVEATRTGQSLPSSMANLCNLQTLVIRFPSFGPHSFHIPIDIWNMQQLRHVRVGYGAFTCEGSTLSEQTADELSLPSNLQTLRNVQAGDWIENYLEKLIKLRTLKIYEVDSSRHGEGLIDSIPKLDHLQSLKLKGEGLIPFPPLLNLLHLFKLHLHGRLGNLPESHEFSPILTKLTLYGSELEQDPTMILEKLANLRVLRLEYASYLGKEMVCSRQGFPRLEFLVIGLYDLEEWRVEEGSMPSLLKLRMYGSRKLKMLPEGLQHVTTLKKLKTSSMYYSFTNRLRNDEGEDWYKIQHIPSIDIGPSY